jgi:OOP family OmpA-OmpF porin
MRLTALGALTIATAFAVQGARAQEPTVVLFGNDRSAFDATGIESIASTARRALLDGAGAVEIVGYADTLGDAAYNRDLGARRANAVAEDLSARGVPSSAIAVTTQGETDLAIETGEGVSEPANRRVVITVSAPGAFPPPDPDRPIRFPLP